MQKKAHGRSSMERCHLKNMNKDFILLHFATGFHELPNYLSYLKLFLRYQLYYTRPRMYLFTYAYDDEDTNELYSEYHLGRQAFRACKKGTKYCAWHREMPEFSKWTHMCLVNTISVS